MEQFQKASVFIKRNCGKTVNAGGLWVFDNEIERIEGEYENGDIVKVKDFKDRVVGLGFINNNSKIRIRLLTRDKKEQIDNSFFERRLKECWEYRKKVVDTNCCRLVFGEADFLPGITIDKFSDYLVVQSLALGIDKYKLTIVETLISILKKDGINIKGVYERSDAQVRLQEGLQQYSGFLENTDPFDTDVSIIENGIKYIVDVAKGQKTGYFLDQKYNREAIRKFANGGTVLDCFTHTGSFALNASVGGATEVTAIDVSKHAIECAKENARLNNITNINFVVADIFDILPQMVTEKKQFDLVVLDPPAFTKSKNAVGGATKGYKEINYRALRLVKDGGFFATCSCSHFMAEDLFKSVVAEAAKDAGVSLRQVEVRTQSPDHPVLWGASESYYLKFIIFQVFAK